MDAEAAKKCPPSALVRHLLTRTKTEGYPRSRHAMRIVPVDAVCFAGMEEIKKAVEPFVAKHFPAGAKEEEKKTFAIQARSYIF
jgi:tRNA acetyltransferase TAN1